MSLLLWRWTYRAVKTADLWCKWSVRYGERWLIDRYNISHTLPDSDGVIEKIDPRIPDDWYILISDVLKTLPAPQSNALPILAMAVDSGGEDGVTDNAYQFWRKCRRDGYAKRV